MKRGEMLDISRFRWSPGFSCPGAAPGQVYLTQRLARWRTWLYCTDAYTVLLPLGQRYAGKDETHGIERDNARKRHWMARFRRRSIVVSKARRMVDVSLALFARFAGNDRIGDLLSMRA